MSPSFKEASRLSRFEIATGLQQARVRRSDYHERKWHDCDDEHGTPEPQRVGRLSPTRDATHGSNRGERCLHHGCSFVAWRPLQGRDCRAAGQSSRVLDEVDVDRRAREKRAGEDGNQGDEFSHAALVLRVPSHTLLSGTKAEWIDRPRAGRTYRRVAHPSQSAEASLTL
jgi:hypothetical protein